MEQKTIKISYSKAVKALKTLKEFIIFKKENNLIKNLENLEEFNLFKIEDFFENEKINDFSYEYLMFQLNHLILARKEIECFIIKQKNKKTIYYIIKDNESEFRFRMWF